MPTLLGVATRLAKPTGACDMITADTLKTLTTFTAPALQRAVGEKAEGQTFTSAKFLGITNGGQFCYTVVFPVKGGTDSGKVFLTYNPAEGRVIADCDL